MAGELDVEAMLRRHTAKWFAGWEAYYALEPFGDDRADYYAASIAQMIYNVNRGKDQKARPLKDFLLRFEADEKPKPKQTWQEQLVLMKMLAAAYATDAPVLPPVIEEAPPAVPSVSAPSEPAPVPSEIEGPKAD